MKHRHRWPKVALACVALAALLALANRLAPQGPDVSAQGDTLYVDADATGANDGTSWEDAYTTLQPALEDAKDGDQIWVAAGTCYPSVVVGGSGDRYKTFQMLNGVGIYGGFDPSVGDVLWEDRDWVANETILSGDIGALGDPDDNCYRVFYHPYGTNLDSSAILDGFTVKGGNADGDGYGWYRYGGGMHNNAYSSPAVTNCTFSSNSARDSGGGMYNGDHSSPVLTSCTFSSNSGGGMVNDFSEPMLTDCTFSSNSGGGMRNEYMSSPTLTKCTFSSNSGSGMSNITYSSPILTDCTFSNNHADSDGGGMSNWKSSPVLDGCIFSGNSASGNGGGMSNESDHNCAPRLTNCIFSGNSAAGVGGGMFNDLAVAPMLTNCTFWGNSASWGAAMFNATIYSAVVTNCIMWGDSPDEIVNDARAPEVTYSDIQGGYTGTGNIDAHPLFVDPENGDFHLGAGSPCIDTGTNDAPNLPDYDFEGDPRVMDGDRDGTATVDVGVDEAYGYALYVPLVLTGR